MLMLLTARLCLEAPEARTWWGAYIAPERAPTKEKGDKEAEAGKGDNAADEEDSSRYYTTVKSCSAYRLLIIRLGLQLVRRIQELL